MLLVTGLILESCLADGAQFGHDFGLLQQGSALQQQAKQHGPIKITEARLDDEATERNLAIRVGFIRKVVAGAYM